MTFQEGRFGKGGSKRHRKVLRDNTQGISKPAIHRLARREGVKRIWDLIYTETRGNRKVFVENAVIIWLNVDSSKESQASFASDPRAVKVFVEHVIRDTVTYTEDTKKKTVTTVDVVYALKR